MRINAIRSRCALFMLACILNTKAEKRGSKGSIISSFEMRGRGGMVSFKNCSRKGSTPKLLSAEPKNTGLRRPLLTFSMSKS